MLKEWERCEIQSLHKHGDSIRRIEEVTHHHRKTICKILDKGADGGTLKADAHNGKSVRRKQPGREKSLEPFKEFLLNEIEKGGSTAKLLMELRGLGNRTTWRMDDLYAVLSNQGLRISRANIRKRIRAR